MGKRLQFEAQSLRTMVRMYCKHEGHCTHGLCADCAQLMEYAEQRIRSCPYGESKPACRKCSTHCYRNDMRQVIRKVMRSIAPLMPLRHPLVSVHHLIHALTAPRRQRR